MARLTSLCRTAESTALKVALANICMKQRPVDPGCGYLNNAIRKYGKACFKVETVDTVHTSEQDHWERWYINAYNTYEGPGYNLTAGGSAQVVCPSEETRQLLSDQRRKYDSDLPMYIYTVNRVSGEAGYAMCNPKTRKTKSFTWQAELAASDWVTPCNDPNFCHLSSSNLSLKLACRYTVQGQQARSDTRDSLLSVLQRWDF